MMTEEQRHRDSLDRQVDALRREITPQRDLWPGIASRLGQRLPAREERAASGGVGRWFPVGAALVAGYLIASWFPLPWAPGVAPVESDVNVTAPVTLLSSVEPVLAQLPAKTRAVVEVDLSGLAQDRLSIEQALAADPTNPLLLELRSSTEARTVSLLERMNHLTDAAASEGLEM
jgi:hypothetical protein